MEKEFNASENINEKKMVDDAFNHLLQTYLDSPHRKKS